MGGEPSNLVTETLGGNNGDLGGKTLVGLEVEGEARVVLFDKVAGGTLDRLGADTTLCMRANTKCIEMILDDGKEDGWMDREQGGSSGIPF